MKHLFEQLPSNSGWKPSTTGARGDFSGEDAAAQPSNDLIGSDVHGALNWESLAGVVGCP